MIWPCDFLSKHFYCSSGYWAAAERRPIRDRNKWPPSALRACRPDHRTSFETILRTVRGRLPGGFARLSRGGAWFTTPPRSRNTETAPDTPRCLLGDSPVDRNHGDRSVSRKTAGLLGAPRRAWRIPPPVSGNHARRLAAGQGSRFADTLRLDERPWGDSPSGPFSSGRVLVRARRTLHHQHVLS